MEALPRAEPNRHRRGVELALAMVLSFVAIFALHGQMQPEVLRAETGYYQVIAHTSPRHVRTLVRGFWTQSSHGHYTPLAFTAEFFFAKHAGLRPNWWRNRQLFLGALLTFLFFGLIRAAAEQTRPPPFAAALLAAAATLILVAQPLMRDLLQWPFHGLQIGWMIFATATGWALVRLPGSANKGPLLWLIALTAYGSMHVLGLGLAVVTGTVAVFSLILIGAVTGSFPEFKLQVRTLVATLIFLAVAGSAHALAMIVLNDAPANAGLNSGRLPDWHQLVGLYVLFPISIVAGLVGARLDQGLIDGILHSAWAVGAAGLLAIGLFIAVLAKTKRQTRPSPRCAALFLSLFSAVMLITIVAMIFDAGDTGTEWRRPFFIPDCIALRPADHSLLARDRPRRPDALVSAPACFRGRRFEPVRSGRNCWPSQLPVSRSGEGRSAAWRLAHPGVAESGANRARSACGQFANPEYSPAVALLFSLR